MRWGLDSSKAVKEYFPNTNISLKASSNTHSDDEDDSDTDADNLKDKTTVTI